MGRSRAVEELETERYHLGKGLATSGVVMPASPHKTIGKRVKRFYTPFD